MVVEWFHSSTCPHFSLPPSLTFCFQSHQKCHHCTRYKKHLLCYHYSYKTWQLQEVIQHVFFCLFFVILWHHERQGGGVGWFWEGSGGLKPAVSSLWQRRKQPILSGCFISFFFFFFFCTCMCLSEGVSNSEHLHCQVRSSKEERKCWTEPSDGHRWKQRWPHL